ncbi:Carbonic anhydrase, chloroplastic [Morella rubra]|uniref:Carbonic anhydrase n=1 Tax=Morella rubra TaxID=262757 RepID=A0A6A1VCW9_9ROSI|nr:Carbonic anhydrase, chloroplastic [Morella rubra]KAB1209718.1 Carbonic anhydrase, chloroplastic [Morella rubra]
MDKCIYGIEGPRARVVMSRMAGLNSSGVSGDSFRCSTISGFTYSFVRFPRYWSDPYATKWVTNEARVGLLPSASRNQALRLKASNSSLGLAQEQVSQNAKNVGKIDAGQDLFADMKQRFLDFKKHKYTKELEHFQTISKAQYPKNGPSETNAALEFAVNTLEVENILVVGHSSCGGIQALMSMQDEAASSFLEKWVVNGEVAKLRTKADAAHLCFDQQCRHCEKESVNRSLLNLLSYPWIQERVRKELLSIHGGYYNFLNCSFEKWTLDVKGSNAAEGFRYSVKDQAFWY